MTDIKQILEKFFGLKEFRPGQKEIIQTILQGRNVLTVMPTGGGKSLCYQLPALISEGTAIVFSPLIALMKDQVDGLLQKNYPVSFINSTLNYLEINSRLDLARNGKLKLLYIAPERLESKHFIKALVDINVSFIAVDEAHCISEWGHDFRPSYLHINNIFQYLKPVPVIALTATATPKVQDDIINILQMENTARFVTGFDRPNLSYKTINASNKTEIIVDIIKETKSGSSIIYAGTRKRVDKFASELRKSGIKAYHYHAGLSEFERKQQQDYFINDEHSVIVATNAFGMGIDKANVRNVIHVDYTSTLEAYYQEAGRAGRDGKPASCVLIYEAQDYFLQEFFIKARFPVYNDIIKIYNLIYDLAQISQGGTEYNALFLSDAEIANKAALPVYTVQSILKLFEKEKIIIKGSSREQAKIKLNFDRNYIYDYYEELPEIKKPVLEALLRSVSSEAFRQAVEIDPLSILSKYNLSPNVFKKVISEFNSAGIINYYSPQTEPGLSLLAARLPNENIPIDFDKIETGRELAQKKLEIVRLYATTNQCKRNFILEYFGEKITDGTCGRCSSCNSPSVETHLSEKEKFLINQTISAVKVLNERYGKNFIKDFLKGKKTKRINEGRLYEIEGFASAKNFPETEIISAINNAILSGYITQTADIYPVLKLTMTSRKETNAHKANINFREHQGELNSGDLYEQFDKLRLRLAEARGIQPRGIISDRTMRLLAKMQPTNTAEMASLSGISSAFMSNFGELFLDIIIDATNEQKNIDAANKQNIQKPIYKKIHSLLAEKNSFASVANELNLTEADTARIIQEMLESGENPNVSYFFDESVYLLVKSYLSKYPNAVLKDLKSALKIKTGLPLLRIMIAKARFELQKNNK